MIRGTYHGAAGTVRLFREGAGRYRIDRFAGGKTWVGIARLHCRETRAREFARQFAAFGW